MDIQTDGQMDIQTDVQIDIQTNVHMDIKTDVQMDIQTDLQNTYRPYLYCNYKIKKATISSYPVLEISGISDIRPNKYPAHLFKR